MLIFAAIIIHVSIIIYYILNFIKTNIKISIKGIQRIAEKLCVSYVCATIRRIHLAVFLVASVTFARVEFAWCSTAAQCPMCCPKNCSVGGLIDFADSFCKNYSNDYYACAVQNRW